MPKTTSSTTEVKRAERLFTQWVVTKHAREVGLSVVSKSKNTVVCVYYRYKAHLKNVGKRRFDPFGDTQAQEEWAKWLGRNDIDTYIEEHREELIAKYTLHKSNLYAKYKQRKQQDGGHKTRHKTLHSHGDKAMHYTRQHVFENTQATLPPTICSSVVLSQEMQ